MSDFRFIGPVRIQASGPKDVRIQIPRVIGRVHASASRETIKVDIQIPRVIGRVSTQVARPTNARLRLPRVIGRFRARVSSGDNPWARYGFPLPTQDYSYQPSESLIRTQMFDGYTRQRRMWTDGYRQASVSLELTQSQLVEFEAFLDEIGGDWFKMPLVTGDNPSRVAVDHRVRVIGDHSVSEVDWRYVKVTMEVEIRSRRSLLVTTTLYPLEAIESTEVAAGQAFTGVLAVGVLNNNESTSMTAPTPFTGTLEQTTIRFSYLESTSVTVPTPFTGTLEQITIRFSDLESTSVTAPAPFTGTLEQTVWQLRIDDLESTSVTAPAPFTGTLQ